MEKQKCFKCEKELYYDESIDKDNNELAPIKIRKIVIDKDKNYAPLYSMPKDKQKLVGDDFIHFMCSDCIKTL